MLALHPPLPQTDPGRCAWILECRSLPPSVLQQHVSGLLLNELTQSLWTSKCPHVMLPAIACQQAGCLVASLPGKLRLPGMT